MLPQDRDRCAVDLYLDQQNIDTNHATWASCFSRSGGAFAEFKRTMIKQRIHNGRRT
jgi:hypothetical protein